MTGGLTLADDWAAQLNASVARFNELAETGVDSDFGRGERAVQQLFNGDVREEPGRSNPTMWPLSESGPYYAALVTGGTLDTKGGPKTDAEARVLDDLDQPIAGLYGVGNCVASRLAQGVLGGRGHDRPDARLRLPRGAGRGHRAGQGPRARGCRVLGRRTRDGFDA